MSDGLARPAVYVITAHDIHSGEWQRTKVGYSVDPVSRLTTISAREHMQGRWGLSYEMYNFIEHDRARSIERDMHAFLVEFSLGGEWYDAPAEYIWPHLQRLAT